MQTYPKLLLIDDNRSLATALREALRNDYEIDLAHTGKTGLYRSDLGEYDLILLDLQLPDVNGLAVCQTMRERGITQPILILSAEAKVLSKINLLDAGANDYLTKPFSLGELKARVRALLRTTTKALVEKPATILVQGDVVLNPITYEVSRAGQILSLRRKEFLLLEYLMMHPNQVVSREQLVRYAWRGDVKPWANTIDVHIKYLRDKIDRPFSQPIIKTVHGLGYKIVAKPAREGIAIP